MDGRVGNLTRTSLGALLLALLTATACKVSVEDFERWRNRPRSEDRFVEWMLDVESTPEIRSKAVEMLFEQYRYEGAENIPRVGELPPDQRDQAIRDALPHIHDLFEGLEFSLGRDVDCWSDDGLTEGCASLRPEQARDGAYMLMELTDDPALKGEIIDQVIFAWLEAYYAPCTTSVGRHPSYRILSVVGPERGVPVVRHVIREGSLEELYCQDSYIRDVTWFTSSSEELAQAYVERWQNRRPSDDQGLIVLLDAMGRIEGSSVLKDFMFQQLLENSSLHVFEAAVFTDYVINTADVTDAPRFERLVSFPGASRWIGFENLIRLLMDDGLQTALDALPPAEQNDWGQWDGRDLTDGFRRAADFVCTRSVIAEHLDGFRTGFETNLSHENLAVKALSLRCLSHIGTAESIGLIEPLLPPERRRRADPPDPVVPAWADPSAERDLTTLGVLAQETIDEINLRLNPPPISPENPEPNP